MERPIRVFISYSHRDQELVDKLARIIKDAGMIALWSKNLSTGLPFGEEIKRFIEHAHVFMPVLTESAFSRGWVHQEIGYAIGLHIPIFPVTTEEIIESGMLQQLQTNKLSSDLEQLKSELHIDKFKSLLRSETLPALYLKANHVEDRAKMMKEYADNVSKVSESCQLNPFSVIRQKGGLSSFHIPDKPIAHADWTNRYAPETRGQLHKKLQRAERVALYNHAIEEGCRLIINPYYSNLGRSSLAKNTRISNLIEFLELMPENKVVIAIQNLQTEIASLTMVGDWFLAESVSYRHGDGFTHTFFTRNASEISKRIDEFEDELADLLKELKWTEENSRDRAVQYLRGMLEE